MSNFVNDTRLAQIIGMANSYKEQAVADLDYEEAALWRDAKQMALEICEHRKEAGDERLTDAQLQLFANKISWFTAGNIRMMAAELLQLREQTGTQFVTPGDKVAKALGDFWGKSEETKGE